MTLFFIIVQRFIACCFFVSFQLWMSILSKFFFVLYSFIANIYIVGIFQLKMLLWAIFFINEKDQKFSEFFFGFSSLCLNCSGGLNFSIYVSWVILFYCLGVFLLFHRSICWNFKNMIFRMFLRWFLIDCLFKVSEGSKIGVQLIYY